MKRLRKQNELHAIVFKVAVKFAVSVLLFSVFGCKVTENRIELWKGTKNGPPKIAEAVLDDELSVSIRTKALIALIEIANRNDRDIWSLFEESLRNLSKKDLKLIIEHAIPILAKKLKSKSVGVSKNQSIVKDALFLMYSFAESTSKTEIERILIDWCIQDNSIEETFGKYSVKEIITAFGNSGIETLIKLLNPKSPAILEAAELIREIGDVEVIKRSSTVLYESMVHTPTLIGADHIKALSIIGEDPAARYLLGAVSDEELSVEIRQSLLNAYWDGVKAKRIVINAAHLGMLFEIAENFKQPKFLQENAYRIISNSEMQEALPKIKRLLRNKDMSFRLLGLECVLRLDGENSLEEALDELSRSRKVETEEEISAIVEIIASFITLQNKITELLIGRSVFVIGIVVMVLEKNGQLNDIKYLKSLEKDERNLPKGFKNKKLQDAVNTAIGSIKQRG